MSFPRIVKKNQNQNLGRFNKELVIRLVKENYKNKNILSLVIARRRSKAGSRYDKLGFFEIFKDKNRSYNILGLNRNKIKQALAIGASFHLSVYKLLIK